MTIYLHCLVLRDIECGAFNSFSSNECNSRKISDFIYLQLGLSFGILHVVKWGVSTPHRKVQVEDFGVASLFKSEFHEDFEDFEEFHEDYEDFHEDYEELLEDYEEFHEDYEDYG